MTMVKIGHARSSETGTKYGTAGDQTGREVSISDWYDAGWSAVFRPKSTDTAERVARFIEAACTNDHIGYSQDDRMSLFYALKTVGYDPRRVNKDVNCDCSSLVASALIYAGLSVPAGITTASEEKALMDTGAFTKIVTNLKTCDYLKRGDILHKQGHTAVALGYGKCQTGEDTAAVCYYRDTYYNGTWKLVEAANLRRAANLGASVMKVLKRGAEVRCYGYYNKDDRGVNWLYVETTINHVLYTGFLSEKVVVKK